MLKLSTLTHQWPTKLVWLILGGALIHFAPRLYIIALVGAAILLIAHHRKIRRESGTHWQAARRLLGHVFPTPAPQPKEQEQGQPRQAGRQRRPIAAVDARHYTEPEAVTDDGYRCFEHGLNHDCPVDDD